MSSPAPPPSLQRSGSARPRRPTRDLPPIPPEAPDVQSPSVDVPRSSPPAAAASELADIDKEEPTEVLTPLRAHYLKKSLIQLQFEQELDAITTSSPNNVSTLSYLGPPFNPPPKDTPPLDLPFLRYMFRQFILTFPFMASAPKDFYSDKLQPFMGAMLSRNLSPSSVFDEDRESERALRMKLLARLERNLSLFVGAAIQLVEREEVVRLSQSDLDRIETLAKKREARNLKRKEIFEVNIVSVRTVTDKGRMRSRVHEEFIIRTRRSNHPDWFVSRRYGDFRTLANELRKAHPQEDIRPPPAKNRTAVSAPTPPPMTPVSFASRQTFSQQSWDEQPVRFPASETSAPFSGQSQTSHPSLLAREKNRLTLRAYLHSLLSSPTIASSPVLRSFLLSGPTTLSPEELEDTKWREEADRVREEGRKRFAREIAGRVDGLRSAIRDVKGDIMGRDGLTTVFATIKVTPHVRDLPPNYQSVIEWARISLASTVFQQLVASDNASENFASLKRLHGLMPYFMLKAALKITNPMGMIRSVLDLFLAQPFGGRSLLQRMFTGSLTEEVRALEEEIEAVRAKVEDPIMCEKVKLFVYAPKEIQDMYKADAASENLNLLTVILRSGDQPVLSRAQLHRVAKAHRAHAIYMRHRESLDDSDDDDGPQDDDAWLYEDLKILGHLYSRLRDREQLIALIFEGFTAELLKDIITIFYAPLAQVYRAASIADSLSDLQNFINDLIRTVEQTEELSQEDPGRTVQIFIELIQRHEQSFYNFVHKVHSKGEGLFDNLMKWIELFLTVMREGIGKPISLEFLLPHKGKERADILAEVDKVALYHYKLKILYEDKLRRRFGRSQGQHDADAEDQATKALVDGVVGEISFGEVVQGDAIDVAAEAEETDSDESSSEYQTGSEDDSEEETDSDEESDEDESEELAKTPNPADLRQVKSAAIQPTSSQWPQSPSSPSKSRNRPPDHRRPRSLSNVTPLKASRSLSSLRDAFRGRRSEDVPPPPVPPMPRNPLVVAMSKPLPPSPSTSSIERSRERPPNSAVSTPPPGKKRKAKAASLHPPELHHIPQLLPVFKEMMRPLLRPRPTTQG
ncbi:px domain-containing protein [Moniliophthora roreri MCA 2997]|uniref:Px domain-containing protein n=2 Tax=Moniliophthora roreri TaxID=221103 RepID=V2X9Z2_MONRO|nr:px domain-containing protein [Moniliophthora roreri MCA 2997]KAI3612213.1 px domain-containing protein [Moniliophthora roreri]